MKIHIEFTNPRVKKVLVGILLTVTMLFIGAWESCGSDRLQEIQKSVGEVELKNYPERRNLVWKATLLDNLNMIQWCTWFSDTGVPLHSQAVLNKPTSGGKRLNPSQLASGYSGNYFSIKFPGDSATYYTHEIAGVDGAFGQSNPDESFGFGAGGNQDYFQTTLKYWCGTKPQTWQNPTINVGVDEALYRKQLLAEQALRDGKCLDNALNVVACAPQTPAPVKPTPPAGPQPTQSK